MIDQATQLRELARHSVSQPNGQPAHRPRLIVVAGAKPGVGVTTVAWNLAVALSANAIRTVLVDGGNSPSNISPALGIRPAHGIVDVMTARREIEESLCRGPNGLLVLAGQPAVARQTDHLNLSHQRLLRKVAELGSLASMVLLDIGQSEAVRLYWQAADEVILVTPPDDASVMESYAVIKRLLTATQTTIVEPQFAENSPLPVSRRDPLEAGASTIQIASTPKIQILVNQASEEYAENVFQRVAHSCLRFLDLPIEQLGHLPHDAQLDGQPALLDDAAADNATIAAVQEIVRRISVESNGSTVKECQATEQVMKVWNSTKPNPASSPIT